MGGFPTWDCGLWVQNARHHFPNLLGAPGGLQVCEGHTPVCRGSSKVPSTRLS